MKPEKPENKLTGRADFAAAAYDDRVGAVARFRANSDAYELSRERAKARERADPSACHRQDMLAIARAAEVSHSNAVEELALGLVADLAKVETRALARVEFLAKSDERYRADIALARALTKYNAALENIDYAFDAVRPLVDDLSNALDYAISNAEARALTRTDRFAAACGNT